jgi:hypothetical protein
MIDAPGRLAGRVVSEDGMPIGAFTIGVRNTSTGQLGTQRLFSARPDGSWSIENVAAGSLEVIGSDPSGRQAVVSTKLEPSGAVTDLTLRLAGIAKADKQDAPQLN